MGYQAAYLVLRCIVVVHRFDMANEGGAEHLLTAAHSLQRNPLRAEHYGRRPSLETISGAVDVKRRRCCWNHAMLKHNHFCSDAMHVTKANNIPDAAELRQFGASDSGAAVHGRAHGGVDPQEEARNFKPFK